MDSEYSTSCKESERKKSIVVPLFQKINEIRTRAGNSGSQLNTSSNRTFSSSPRSSTGNFSPLKHAPSNVIDVYAVVNKNTEKMAISKVIFY